METTQQLKYCLYARKSSEQDERQAMSIDSQIKEMMVLAERESMQIVEVRQESHSAKESGQRPVFVQLLKDIRAEKFNAVLTWAPDRLSRNAGDLGSLVDLMDQEKLVKIRTHSQSFTNNPNEKFLLMILCSQAKLENDNRGLNVKRGIRAKCEMGWRPCTPPLGYFNRAMAIPGLRDTVIDPERAPIVIKMFEMSADGKSGRHIKSWLDSINAQTRNSKGIVLSQIYNILKNPFYYGMFEYPKRSGNWYQGKHEPLVSKELFDKVQQELIVPIKSKWGAKEFPFRRFLSCGGCGAKIVGEEKYKTLKNGKVLHFVYYHCSRQVDHSCKEPWIREEKLIKELIKLCDTLLPDISELEPGLSDAIDKYVRMMRSTHKSYAKKKLIPGYVRYVLEGGTEFEKTRLVRNLRTNLSLCKGGIKETE